MESGLLGPILSVGVGTVQPGTADTSSRKFLPSDQSSTHTSCCREGVYTPATLGISGGAAGEDQPATHPGHIGEHRGGLGQSRPRRRHSQGLPCRQIPGSTFVKTTPVEQCGSVQPRILAGGSCPVPTLRMAQFTAAFYSFASWVVVCQLTELKSVNCVAA